MRYLLIFLAFLAPIQATALTGGSARFDFTNGQPSIVDNQTSLCTGQTTVRYDFVSGQPAQVFDATATCTAAGAAATSADAGVYFFD